MSKTPLAWHKHRLSKEMSSKAELVLNIVCDNNQPLHIMELMRIAQALKIGSMVSCHNALTWLVTNGYAKLYTYKVDKRIKQVEITKKGLGYFA